MVVSQFTLLADARKGNRPSNSQAARPETAVPLYEYFIDCLGKLSGKEIKTGVFGADMQIELCNDGPVTIWLDSISMLKKN
jgi:D-tyrosyl-tRNA(Tyr) deacylase